MLDLDSPRWADFTASGGGSGISVAQLLRRVFSRDYAVYPELAEQIRHQFTPGTVAYVAVPHLVNLARTVELRQRVSPLSIVGTVAAARLAYARSAPSILDAWRDEYLT